MADDPFKQIIEDMRTRLQAELAGQVQALEARQAEAVTQARRAAEAEAESRWGSKLDALKAEGAARLESEVAAVRADAEKRLVAESMRLRTEAESALAAERERALEALDAERRRADDALTAERARAEQAVLAERSRGDQELQRTRTALEAERDAAQRAGLDPTAILVAVRGIDGGHTLSETLGAIVHGAAAQAPRVALFIANGARLDEWPVAGVAPMAPRPVDLERAGLLRSALVRGNVVSSDGDDPARMPPAFASLPAGRRAVAAPLVVGGQSVGVLYADEGTGTAAPPGWTDAVELVARHGAAALAHLTAARTVQLLQGRNGHRAAIAPPDDEQSARRYAKLLVSEIKLYNEGAVRVGRERRDLLHRLRAEIERARRLYDERVSPSVPARAAYFQQELVQTLAGGDPALLGS